MTSRDHVASERRVRATVWGRVQGVAFRMSAQREAERLSLGGTARNCPDGTVEVEAQGPSEQIDAFIKWLWRGPSLARVDRVEVVEQIAQQDAIADRKRFFRILP